MRTRFQASRQCAGSWVGPEPRGGANAGTRVARLRRFGLLRLIFRWLRTEWRVRVALTLCVSYTAVVMLPTGLAWTVHHGPLPSPVAGAAGVDVHQTVRVYRMDTGSVVTVSLSDYIQNVLAAQMPADAPLAALEADAVAIRTYAVRAKTAMGGSAFARDHGADVTDDPGLDLPWQTAADRDVRYGEEAPVYEARLAQAVKATDGLILTYQGQPILAFTCQMSPGRTRDASTVFSRTLPYLPSVPCPDDASAPDLVRTTRIMVQDLQAALDLPSPVDPRAFRVAGTDHWGFVQTVTYGTHRWSGDVFAGKLGLPSTDFTLTADAHTLTVRTVGTGSGLGMSLHEARALAGSGASWKSILATFYPGTRVESLTSILQAQ